MTDRLIELDGTVNLRDVGGYRTVDGRRVRWRRLLRSDSLGDLSDADVAILDEIGLACVCDLRDPQERAEKPDRPLGPDVSVHEITVFPVDTREMLAGLDDMEVEDVHAWMRGTYRGFVLDHRPAYRQLLDTLLLRGALPAIVHCTGGRDRTGVAMMIVLSALGVPATTIAEDYMLSDVEHREVAYLPGADRDKIAALTTPHLEYLQAGREAIHDAFGSMEAYLQDGLGLDVAMRGQLRESLLED